ncbi:MAG: hypothetical protein OXQ84_12055 [bacterium]|nr:hypothetical protein [bacterium]
MKYLPPVRGEFKRNQSRPNSDSSVATVFQIAQRRPSSLPLKRDAGEFVAQIVPMTSGNGMFVIVDPAGNGVG